MKSIILLALMSFSSLFGLDLKNINNDSFPYGLENKCPFSKRNKAFIDSNQEHRCQLASWLAEVSKESEDFKKAESVFSFISKMAAMDKEISVVRFIKESPMFSSSEEKASKKMSLKTYYWLKGKDLLGEGASRWKNTFFDKGKNSIRPVCSRIWPQTDIKRSLVWLNYSK